MPVLWVTTSYSPLAFLYAFSRPTITINETREKRPWGTHRFELPPGTYLVAISYPWLFSPECGRNSVEVVLREEDHKHVRYVARLVRYWPGKLSVDEAIPTARALRDRSR